MTEPGPSTDLKIGATFIKINAEHLGLDWRSVYKEIIDDVGIKQIRIPVFWDQLEQEPGKFDWADLDWQMQQAAQSQAKVMLAVGHRVPRYPECYAPEWTKPLDEATFKRSLFRMTEAVVQHFKDNPALDAWQVENEPLAKILGVIWGDAGCREISHFVKEEVAMVKRLDEQQHPTIVTYAFSPWPSSQLRQTIEFDSDVVAITLFNKLFFRSPVFNGYVEMFKFGPMAPLRLAYQRSIVKHHQQDFWVAEMQAEPWGPKGPYDFENPDDAYISMNPDRLNETWDYAANSGASRIYLWGAEWWLSERNKGKSMMLDLVKARLQV
ncbi:beta-galactosidase [filamentous cyanobacterium LEGE 11480]|uniref:Beta-galactosidase n=1 Tax=Romeriopsis navalis LEGE 11480 TaxID=2777977 RepID=A0A928Z687_9CYAN|nr:beta-galactosidase [Romeriopsis navalis]MBE9032358.1 beta-galactosidase [Romeriopsis navalis LEGE 11480]